MSQLMRRLKKIFRTILNEDIKTILIFSLFIFTIYHLYVLGLGWMVQTGLSYNTPSIGMADRSKMPDSDGDLLPDLVETTPKGEAVIWDGKVVGKGTGTNPNLRDSDKDLFTDSAEDNLGTDPNNFFSPGYLYIIWLISIGYVFVEKFRRGDKLREYQEFEEIHRSGGVASSGSKYAYGSSSVFAQKTKNMTEAEKQKLIENDPRFIQMMGRSTLQSPGSVELKLKRFKLRKRSIQIIIAISLAWVIQYFFSN